MVNYYAAPLTFPTSIPSNQTTNQTENINQNIQQHHHRNHHHQQQPSLYYEYFHFIKVCMEWIEVETWNRAKKKTNFKQDSFIHLYRFWLCTGGGKVL